MCSPASVVLCQLNAEDVEAHVAGGAPRWKESGSLKFYLEWETDLCCGWAIAYSGPSVIASGATLSNTVS